MKILPSFRYQLRDQRPAILVYYGVLVAIVILSMLFALFAPEESGLVTTNATTGITSIFIFILSLCCFKESFRMNTQHGVSRRSQFLGRLGAMTTVCAILAAADEVYTTLLFLVGMLFPGRFHAWSLYESLYVSRWDLADSTYLYVQHSLSTFILSIVMSFFMLLAFSSSAYLISLFNYRLNKAGKIAFWVGWPFLFMLARVGLGNYFIAHPEQSDVFMEFMMQVTRFCFGTLPRFCLTCLVFTVIFSALSWLLMRRAPVK